ncbi:hypothetical protein [Methylomonas sp. AM2-LC]|uniref:hypothetical protein n=1 Tax=Methylomonas sp. AM2-LC TaxID=3153301 RepID=UPI0032669375
MKDNKTDSMKTERKKISVDKPTYDQLKTFSRLNGLKMRLVVESMVSLVLEDEQLSARIVDMAIAKENAAIDNLES